MISKDVVFDERTQWQWDKEKNEIVGCDLDNDTVKEGTTVRRNEDSNREQSSQMTDTVNGQEAREPDPILEPTAISENSSTTGGVRNRRNPAWMSDYVLFGELENEGELQEGENVLSFAVFENFVDAISYEEDVKFEKWRKAMNNEISSIERNDTWTLVELPTNAKKIGVKWIYKTKYNEVGQIEKHKARLVAKGYAQQYGIDYSEVFAPVARWDTIRCILAMAAQEGWSVHQLDVKSAFLHGELNEDVFVDQPEGYVKKGKEHMVYHLKKALYGLKQAPRAWYNKIDSYFMKECFSKYPHEHTLCTKIENESDIIIISLNVDDLLYTGTSHAMMEGFKASMKNHFDMSDLGRMRHFLGVEVV